MESVIVHIPHSLLTPSQEYSCSGTVVSPKFNTRYSQYEPLSDLVWDVKIVNGGDSVLYVKGICSVKLQTSCSRCLENFEIDVDGEIFGYVVLNNLEERKDELGVDECIEYNSNHTIDISPLIEGAVIIELPISPLCSEDCEGIEGYSIKNNDENSGMQHPFEVLKNLKDLNS